MYLFIEDKEFLELDVEENGRGVALFGPAIANAALYIGGVAFMCAAVLGVGVAVLYLDKHRVFY